MVVVKGGRCLGWLVSRLGAVHVNLNVTRCTGRTRTNRYLKKLTRSGGAGGTVWVDLVVRLFGALCSRPPPDPQSVSASTLALHRPCSLLWPSFPGPSCLLPTFPLTHLPPPLPFPTPPPPSPPGLPVGIPQTWGAVSHTGRSHSRQGKRVRLSHRPCHPTRRVRQGRKARQQRTGPAVTVAKAGPAVSKGRVRKPGRRRKASQPLRVKPHRGPSEAASKAWQRPGRGVWS